MGWASGSILFSEIIAIIKPEVPDKAKRKAIYEHLIGVFEEEADWDTLDECVGQDSVYDDIYNERYPPEADDD